MPADDAHGRQWSLEAQFRRPEVRMEPTLIGPGDPLYGEPKPPDTPELPGEPEHKTEP